MGCVTADILLRAAASFAVQCKAAVLKDAHAQVGRYPAVEAGH